MAEKEGWSCIVDCDCMNEMRAFHSLGKSHEGFQMMVI